MATLLEKIENEQRTHARLSDFIKIKHGFAFKGEYFSAKPTKDILVTPGNFAIGGGFKADKFKYYAGSVPDDYVLKAGDLVVTMTDLSVDADTLGYSALIPNDANVQFLHNQRVGLVRQIKEGIDLGFLYYLMRTREYQSYVVGGASGSTVKHTSPDRIASFEYDFPSLPTQRKIAEILSAYDEKIQNNKKVIKNLEEAILNLFSEWFVNNHFPEYEKTILVDTDQGLIPKGWDIVKIGDFCETYGGGTPGTKESKNWEGGDIAWATPSDLTAQDSIFIDHTAKSITKYGLDNSSAKLLPKDSILMTSRATVGVISLSTIPMTTNQGFISCVCDTPYKTSFLFWWLRTHIDIIKGLATGSTFPEINKSVFRNIAFVLPKSEVLLKFHAFAESLSREIYILQNQNSFLNGSENRLLEKLI